MKSSCTTLSAWVLFAAASVLVCHCSEPPPGGSLVNNYKGFWIGMPYQEFRRHKFLDVSPDRTVKARIPNGPGIYAAGKMTDQSGDYVSAAIAGDKLIDLEVWKNCIPDACVDEAGGAATATGEEFLASMESETGAKPQRPGAEYPFVWYWTDGDIMLWVNLLPREGVPQRLTVLSSRNYRANPEWSAAIETGLQKLRSRDYEIVSNAQQKLFEATERAQKPGKIIIGFDKDYYSPVQLDLKKD